MGNKNAKSNYEEELAKLKKIYEKAHSAELLLEWKKAYLNYKLAIEAQQRADKAWAIMNISLSPRPKFLFEEHLAHAKDVAAEAASIQNFF